MLPIPPRRIWVQWGLIPVLGVLATGCTDPQVIIDDSLAASNPAAVEGPVGPPPVGVKMLDIEETPMPPTHVRRVDPQPILPRMDKAYEERRLPEGVEAGAMYQKADEREVPEPSPVQQGEEDPADPGDTGMKSGGNSGGSSGGGPAMEGK